MHFMKRLDLFLLHQQYNKVHSPHPTTSCEKPPRQAALSIKHMIVVIN